MMEKDDRQQDPPISDLPPAKSTMLEPNEDIQFGYHSASDIRITHDGLGAETVDASHPVLLLIEPPHRYYGRTFGTHSLKGRAEFEVKIVARWRFRKIRIGVMRCRKGIPINVSCLYSCYIKYYMWWGDNLGLQNELTGTTKWSNYGSIDVSKLEEGNCVGLYIYLKMEYWSSL